MLVFSNGVLNVCAFGCYVGLLCPGVFYLGYCMLVLGMGIGLRACDCVAEGISCDLDVYC